MLNSQFESNIDIPKIKVDKRQKLETLIDYEAPLLAKHWRDEIRNWKARITKLS